MNQNLRKNYLSSFIRNEISFSDFDALSPFSDTNKRKGRKMNQNLNPIQYERKAQSGRTMLEMLGVLAIMGLITYGAIAGINYGMTSYKINQMYSEVQDIVQGIEDLYSWSKGYPTSGDDIMSAAEANDIFSGNTKTCDDGSTKCAKGSFGDIRIEPTEAGKNFKVTYFNIPADSCQRISDMDWTSFSVETKKYQGSSELLSCPENGFVTFVFSPSN